MRQRHRLPVHSHCATLRRLLVLVAVLSVELVVVVVRAEDARVSELIRDWAPLVWLAPGERFLPLGVPEFLDNMQADDDYLKTRLSLQLLLQNKSSFLHGRRPAGEVPIYALVKNCLQGSRHRDEHFYFKNTQDDHVHDDPTKKTTNSVGLSNELSLPAATSSSSSSSIETNNVAAGSQELLLDTNALTPGRRLVRSRPVFPPPPPAAAPPTPSTPSDLAVNRNINPGLARPYDLKRRKLKKKQRLAAQRDKLVAQDKLHFHVTYWMFYPFSEGKAVCVLDLGFLGSWPIPSLGGVCLGKQREYGSHVGDWEHVSLYFKGKDHPLAMYVSAHDAGAFYRYEPRANTFLFESQETRKGIFQKPNFPERVYTAEGSHPVLFSARGSHGLWTAPGKHKFVRLPRLYDESGFGTAWPTWHKLELLSVKDLMPGWMSFTGRWGNPKSNCHPLARLGFNICEFVDGPTGIPMKKNNFRC